MKQLLLTGVLSLAAVGAGRGQTASYYINNGTVTTPIAIDATNFVNNGTFSVFTAAPFDFSNVRNYTNRNVMSGSPGFVFDTAPTSTGVRYPAAYFVNAPLIPNIGNAAVSGTTHLLISATNIINKGALTIGSQGLLQLNGGSVDVSRGVLQVGALGNRTPTDPEQIYDQYWGFYTNRLVPSVNLLDVLPNTPSHFVTNFIPGSVPPYQTNVQTSFVLPPPGLSSADFTVTGGPIGTNRSVQIVFLRNPNTNITTQIRDAGITPLSLGTLSVTWSAVVTNAFGQVTTNLLTLRDTYGANPTNNVITNWPFATQQTLGTETPPPTIQPANYSILRGVQGSGVTGPAYTAQPDSFWGTNPPPVTVDVQYSAYEILISDVTPTANVVTNVRTSPGRILINGGRLLDLNQTRVQGLTYASITGTNHFNGSSNGSISVAYADIALGSTNGVLNAAGLLNPVIPRLSGTIRCYSATWSNMVDFAGSTNLVNFNVLFVDSALSTTTSPQVFDLALRSTNLFIGDTYRVLNKLTLDADRLTVLTNGFLNIAAAAINWADGATHIQSLTNLGAISAVNALYFVSRNADGSDRAYSNFVNRASIFAVGNIVNSSYFENSGTMTSGSGPIFIQADNAVLVSTGRLNATSSDISIISQNLTATNHVIRPGRNLSLMVSGALKTGANSWAVGDGFSLLTKPATGDLQSTTVTNVAAPYENVFNYWAGEDRGVSVSGYTNNGALGWLILTGGLNSFFTYTGTGASNGLYVDRIDFLGSATNRDVVTSNMTSLAIDSNLVIYYAKAMINGVDQSAALDGYNGGRLRQVAGKTSLFSTSQIVAVGNAGASIDPALVQSALGSSSGGNSAASAPGNFINSASINLRVTVAKVPSTAALISWNCVPNAANALYFKNGFNGSWQLLTNIVAGPICKQITAVDPTTPSGRFYKVQVSVP